MEEIIIEARQYDIPEPTCKKCKKKYDIRVNPFQGEDKKDFYIILYGVCEKCNVIAMQRLIKLGEEKS